MHDLIGPQRHGILDIVTVVAFALAPTLFGLEGLGAGIAYALAAVHLVLTLVTRIPIGMAEAVPFSVHGWIEALVGIALLVVPWLLGTANLDRNAQVFFTVAGLVVLVVWGVTNYGEARAPAERSA